MMNEELSSYELKMRIQERREKQGAATMDEWSLARHQEHMEEEEDDDKEGFVCDECGEEVIPGEGCECDFCGWCGESKARDECECDD